MSNPQPDTETPQPMHGPKLSSMDRLFVAGLTAVVICLVGFLAWSGVRWFLLEHTTQEVRVQAHVPAGGSINILLFRDGKPDWHQFQNTDVDETFTGTGSELVVTVSAQTGPAGGDVSCTISSPMLTPEHHAGSGPNQIAGCSWGHTIVPQEK